MKQPLVIYHANCWDGFCAACITRKWLGQDCEFRPAQYGQTPPTPDDVFERDVYILDFSYSRPILTTLAADAKTMTVLDHHKTAEAELRGLPFCTFDMDKSGARLTWEHFYGHGNALCPWLVDYTEDRDLWRHRLEDSEAVNAALRSYPLDFDLWDDFQYQHPVDFTREGEAIRRREKQIVSDHVRNAVPVPAFLPAGALCVNATVMFSEIAGELAKDRPYGACYFFRQDGRKQWSLRSRDGGTDVSVIAKSFGGGGHAQAAGFEE
jgi:oligoribonuclease NrnB/cAMP/cGMP phosphodiesterase (DHH superfamily)